MRVVVAGRGWLAVRGARLFAMLPGPGAAPVEVVCLPVATDEPGARPSWLPSLRRAAERNGWPVVGAPREAGLTPRDLFVSLQFDRIVDVRDLGGARAVNLHFSPLPRHRGSLSCVWPILDRDAEAGVTLHELTAQVDAGPVISTRRFPLPTSLTAGELYRTFHQEGFTLLVEHAAALLAGTYATTPQPPGERAHRRSEVDFGVREVTAFTAFTRPAVQVRDAVLARAFPAFQLPTFGGRPVAGAYTVDLPQVPPGDVGAVVARTATSVLVRCADGLLALEYAE